VIESGVDFILGDGSIDRLMGTFGVAWVGAPDFPGSIVSKDYVVFEF
jgi:hypothetical protein